MATIHKFDMWLNNFIAETSSIFQWISTQTVT